MVIEDEPKIYKGSKILNLNMSGDNLWKTEPLEIFKKFSEDFPEVFKEFMDLIDVVYSKIDPKTRELIIVSILAVEEFEDGFKFHLQELIKRGTTKEEIKSLLLILLPYLGISKFLKVFKWCKEEQIL